MDLKSKEQRLRNGIINQDKTITREIISRTIKKIDSKMEQLIKHLGGTINSEELINSFVVEQFVILREQLILNSIPDTDDITERFIGGFAANINLYTSMVSNPKQLPNPTLWQIAFDGLKPDFMLLLAENKETDNSLNSFLTNQYKRFTSQLIHDPIQFADFSANRFYGFTRKNLFECEAIYKTVREKSVKFILDNFYQKSWYKNETDRMQGIVEDLATDSVIEFYRILSRKTIENPYGLMRTICSNNVIDHYKKNRIPDKKDDEGEKEALSENEGMNTKPKGSKEVPFVFLKNEPISEDNMITSIDLEQIQSEIVDGCPNKKHALLMRLHLDGFGYSEIADRTEFGEKSAKSIVCNIKAKIRRYVGRNYFLDN